MHNIDFNDPRLLAEAAESAELDRDEFRAISEGMTRIIAWCLEGKSPGDVGYRVYIVSYVLYPQLIQGISLEAIAKQMGYGRSGANRLSSQLSEIIGVRGQLQKSHAHRKAQSDRWRLSHAKS